MFVLVTLGLVLSGAEAALATIPEVGTPPAPASLNPPKAFIGMLITFLCFFIVVGVNLIPSKRSDVK